jgi:hypothetical protein
MRMKKLIRNSIGAYSAYGPRSQVWTTWARTAPMDLGSILKYNKTTIN